MVIYVCYDNMFYTLHYITDLFHICTIQWNIIKGWRMKDEGWRMKVQIIFSILFLSPYFINICSFLGLTAKVSHPTNQVNQYKSSSVYFICGHVTSSVSLLIQLQKLLFIFLFSLLHFIIFPCKLQLQLATQPTKTKYFYPVWGMKIRRKGRQHCIFSSIHRYNVLSVSSKTCC